MELNVNKVFMDGLELPKLMFRNEQKEKIERVFKCYEDQEDPSTLNIILIGVTGAGKTFTLNRVLSAHPNHIYVSAATEKKSNQIIALISGINIREQDRVLKETIAKLREEKKVLVIDELNRLEDPKEFFRDLNTIFREANIPIILATNNPFVTEAMEEDARNTLFLENVIFTRYGPGELREICLQRLRLLPNELADKMDEGTLNYICASASQAGSARRALNRVRRCYLDDKFTIEHAIELDKQQENLNLLSFVNSMNDKEKKFLEVLRDLQVKAVRDKGEEFFTSLDVQDALPLMHKSNISQLITIFESKYNFLRTSFIEKGRGGGRVRQIQFVENVLKHLEEELI